MRSIKVHIISKDETFKTKLKKSLITNSFDTITYSSLKDAAFKIDYTLVNLLIIYLDR